MRNRAKRMMLVVMESVLEGTLVAITCFACGIGFGTGIFFAFWMFLK